MKAHTYLLLFMLLAPSLIFSQATWYEDLPGNDIGDRCVATYDGGVVVITYVQNKITKLDAAGTILWSKLIDTTELQSLIAVTETEDHGIVALGSKNNWAATVAIKLDENGNLLWQKQYLPAGQNLTAAFICPAHGDGGFLFGGGECSMQTYVIRIAPNGSILWQKQYVALTNSSTGYLSTMVQAPGSGYFTTYVKIDNSDLDWGLMKIDDNGTFQWAKNINEGTGRDEVAAATATQAGGIAVLGTTNNYQAPNNENKMTLTVFDGSGGRLAYVVYDHTEQLQPYAIAQTTDGGFVLTGSDFSLNTLLVKTDGLGNLQWQKLGTGTPQEGIGLAPAASNMFYLSGYTFAHKAVVAKLSAYTGQGLCQETSLSLVPATYQPTIIAVNCTNTAGTATEAVVNYAMQQISTQPIDICTMVADNAPIEGLGLQIWPNPYLDRIHIDLGGELISEGQLKLYNLQGQLLAERTVPEGMHWLDWELKGLSTGVQILRLESAAGRQTFKLVHIAE